MTISTFFIEETLSTSFSNHPENVEFDHVSIDSRSLQNNANTLFFCLKGQNNDAHQFIASLIFKGVSYFVVEYIPTELKGKAHFCVVPNTKQALQKIAAAYKANFSIKTIGITGSNGKTIVKEWLNFLLSPDNSIVRSPKSYNSQVGVPLSIFGINEKHNLGIFEAGISEKGEMDALATIIEPNIGLFTHLGTAHDEGFQNTEEKLIEKLKLFKNCEVVILEKNDFIEKHLNCPTFTWSLENKNADVVILSKEKKEQKTHFSIAYKTHHFQFYIPFTDDIAIENSLTCLTALLFLNVSPALISTRMAQLYPVETRLQTKKGINTCLLIDDCLSSDYQSLKIALDFLDQQKIHQKKTIILSDIFQSGLDTKQLYTNVIKALQNSKIDRVIAIGETISAQLKDLPNVFCFPSTLAFLQQFNTSSFQNETILVKGARNFHFEEIIVLLEEKKHETKLEINLDALTANLNYYKGLLKSETKIMVMVKAFGYGSGGYEIAKQLEHLNVAYLGVAFADEGIELRKAGITLPIMVLNPENSSFNAIIAYNLEPEIYSINGLKTFLEIAKQKNLHQYPIHIKIDTGMHRLGFNEKEIELLIQLIHQNNFIHVKSIFSHLAASEDVAEKTFTLKQIELFSKVFNAIVKHLPYKPKRHILNTSGIFNYADYQFEMVRLGIGIYGFGNTEEENKHLENVSTLKSIVSQIRTVDAGESISYNRKFIASKKMSVATIPVGYADGIKRAWGNEKGYVLINQQKATILGTICMDMLMVDVTNIDCAENDEVIIFGNQPSIREMAKVIGTIPYEIIAGISQRVQRVYYKN